METRKLKGAMRITRGNERLVAIPSSEMAKLQLALKEMDTLLAAGKTCCDFCCDWCDFSIDWSKADDVMEREVEGKIDLINEVKNIKKG